MNSIRYTVAAILIFAVLASSLSSCASQEKRAAARREKMIHELAQLNKDHKEAQAVVANIEVLIKKYHMALYGKLPSDPVSGVKSSTNNTKGEAQHAANIKITAEAKKKLKEQLAILERVKKLAAEVATDIKPPSP